MRLSSAHSVYTAAHTVATCLPQDTQQWEGGMHGAFISNAQLYLIAGASTGLAFVSIFLASNMLTRLVGSSHVAGKRERGQGLELII